MKRVFILFVLVFFLITPLGLMAESSRTAVGDTIYVKGTGEVQAEPDQAMLFVSVTALDENAEKAKSAADKKYEAVLAVAKKHKIDRLNIKSSGINLRPEYKWQKDKRVLIGTRVSRSINITVRNINNIGVILQDLVEGDVSTINRIQAGFQKRHTLERRALQAAIADAKDKALFLAEQFNKTLGAAHTISESSSQTEHRQYASSFSSLSAKSASVPEEHFGTQSVKATVNVVFHAE